MGETKCSTFTFILSAGIRQTPPAISSSPHVAPLNEQISRPTALWQAEWARCLDPQSFLSQLLFAGMLFDLQVAYLDHRSCYLLTALWPGLHGRESNGLSRDATTYPLSQRTWEHLYTACALSLRSWGQGPPRVAFLTHNDAHEPLLKIRRRIAYGIRFALTGESAANAPVLFPVNLDQ